MIHNISAEAQEQATNIASTTRPQHGLGWKHRVASVLTQFDLWAESGGFSASQLATVGRTDWAFGFDLKTVDFSEDCFVSLADAERITVKSDL